MLQIFKCVPLSKYQHQKKLTQFWKNEHDKQLQAHQDTVIERNKFKDLFEKNKTDYFNLFERFNQLKVKNLKLSSSKKYKTKKVTSCK